jgi:hypothetical protein
MCHSETLKWRCAPLGRRMERVTEHAAYAAEVFEGDHVIDLGKRRQFGDDPRMEREQLDARQIE